MLCIKWLSYFKDAGKKHGNIRRKEKSNNDGNFEGEKWLEHLSHIKSKKESTYTDFSTKYTQHRLSRKK